MVESTISGWQERYPLPESFNNQEFREWAFGLNALAKKQLVTALIVWGEPYGLSSETPDDMRLDVEALETLVGELVILEEGTVDSWSGLTPRHRGGLMRIAGAVLGE